MPQIWFFLWCLSLIIELFWFIVAMRKLQTVFKPQTLYALMIDFPAVQLQKLVYFPVPLTSVSLRQYNHAKFRALLLCWMIFVPRFWGDTPKHVASAWLWYVEFCLAWIRALVCWFTVRLSASNNSGFRSRSSCPTQVQLRPSSRSLSLRKDFILLSCERLMSPNFLCQP